MAIPTTKISLVNQVMNELGRPAVVQAEDDPWSIVIEQGMDDDIQYLLGEHTWTFARKLFTSSSPNVYNPSIYYNYAYTLPPDFLSLYNQNGSLQYQVLQNSLCINDNPVTYYYIANTIDYTILPWYFIRLIRYYRASNVALDLTQNTNVEQAKKQLYINELANAKIQDIMREPINEMPYNPYNHDNANPN